MIESSKIINSMDSIELYFNKREKFIEVLSPFKFFRCKYLLLFDNLCC